MPTSVVVMVIKRLINNRAMVSSTIVGLLITVTLVTSVPLYAEGVSGLLMQRELRRPGSQVQPNSSVFIRHRDRGQAIPTSVADYRAYDVFFRDLIPAAVGLPTIQLVSYLSTDQRALLDIDPDTHIPLGEVPRRITFGFLSTATDFFENVTIIEGRKPSAAVTEERLLPAGELIPVIEGGMTSAALDKWGVWVGDRIGMSFTDPTTNEPHILGVRIVGRMVPNDPESNYWFYPPRSSLDEGGIAIERDVYLGAVLRLYPWTFSEATWFADFDIDSIRATNYERITGGLYTIRLNANAVYENTRLENSPEPIFYDFVQKLFFLKLLLIILSAPIVAIVLYYIVLSAGMVVDRQRNEIAVLKSRGVSTLQIMGIYLLEGALLGGIAAMAGPYLGAVLAQVIGKTFTFLVFTNRDPLPIEVTSSHFLWAGGAAALAILATLIPALGAARHSIVTYKQEVSRSLKRPWFQRFFVDVLVLGAAIYGYVALRGRSELASLGGTEGVFSDPLLVIVPVVFMFAVALVFLRFFPALVAGLARAGNRIWGVAVHLGLRQISREPQQFTRLVFLLILTLSLGTFSASMAATLDKNFDDRVMFRVGAEANFFEIGDWDPDTEKWSFQPNERHLEVPQILRVARLWKEEKSSFRLPGQSYRANTTAYAIDPIDFAHTAWWRPDFSATSLNGLMNELARDEQALIAARTPFQTELNMSIGDSLKIEIAGKTLDFFIAGWANLFPTHYPEAGSFVVVNLPYLERAIGETPWSTLATIDPKTNARALRSTLLMKTFKVIDASDARAEIAAARDDATRIGIFGILSVGFLIAALLTILGFLLYSYMSFRRRMQQLGILRAMGLSVRQLVSLFFFENGFLIALGVVLGTLLGTLTANLFIPFLQLSADKFGDTPPFVILIAWSDVSKIYVLFGAVLVLAFPVSAWLLSKVRIHEAVKFGEEQG